MRFHVPELRAHRAVLLAALSALALAPLTTACEDRTRNEAMLFLTRYDALDLDDPIEERRAAVAALRGLVVSSDEVRSARDACADAYEAEIRAEDRHAEATAELLRASGGGADTVPTEAAARIEAAIQESQESIERTRELFPRCEREARALRLRFSAPRPAQR
ncbi:MAG: hypothetical protein OHK0013_50130 [Sandaracinaceae bacterium]